MKICSQCHKVYDDSVDFCFSCGNKLSTQEDTGVNKGATIQSKKNIFIGIACIVVLVILSCFFINEQTKFNEAREKVENDKAERYLEEQRTAVHTDDLQIESYDYEIDGDYVYIKGSVKNVGDNPISYFEIGVNFFNKQGNVIDSDWTNDGDELLPNQSRKFEIMHKYDNDCTKYKVYVQDVS